MEEVDQANHSDLYELTDKMSSPMTFGQISQQNINHISLQSTQTRHQSHLPHTNNRKVKKIIKINNNVKKSRTQSKLRKNKADKRDLSCTQAQACQSKNEPIFKIEYERILINKNSAFRQNFVPLCCYHLSIADSIFASADRRHFLCHNWRCIITHLDYYQLSLAYKLEYGYMAFGDQHAHFRTRKSPFQKEPQGEDGQDQRAGGFFNFMASHDQSKEWSAVKFRRFSSSLRNEFVASLEKGEKPEQLTEAGLHLLSIFRETDPKATQILKKCYSKLDQQRQYIINLKNINNILELQRKQQEKMKEENQRVQENDIIYDVINLEMGMHRLEQPQNPLCWQFDEEEQ